MKQDSFKDLPLEIIIEILSRPPIRTIMRCKCVCKSWLDVVECQEFIKSHLSKPSTQCLALFQVRDCSNLYKIFEIVDELDHHHQIIPHCNHVFNFSFSRQEAMLIHSSVNGFLFVVGGSNKPHNLYVCNPITRDYITIPPSLESCSPKGMLDLEAFGFGVSKVSHQYKVVRIFEQCSGHAASKCEVYTLGTGSWRSIAASFFPLNYKWSTPGAFLNGNLHWLGFDLRGTYPRISCFDLETEVFSLFSNPPTLRDRDNIWSLSAVGDCLCLCDNSDDDEIVIWFMKKYGDGKSWSKDFVIKKPVDGGCNGFLYPIKIFKDGDMLMAKEHYAELFYSIKAKTIQKCGIDVGYYHGSSFVVYTPSFIPAKTFVMEYVSSF